MKTYEITFIDLGFLVSPELWTAWTVVGLVFGYSVLLQNFFGGPEKRARRALSFGHHAFGWLLFASLFAVFVWPVAIFIWAQDRAKP